MGEIILQKNKGPIIDRTFGVNDRWILIQATVTASSIFHERNLYLITRLTEGREAETLNSSTLYHMGDKCRHITKSLQQALFSAYDATKMLQLDIYKGMT